jgi:hypothetical protein
MTIIIHRKPISSADAANFSAAGMALFQPFYGLEGMRDVDRESRWQVPTASVLFDSPECDMTIRALRTRVTDWQAMRRPMPSWVLPRMADELASSAADFRTLADMDCPYAAFYGEPLFGPLWGGFMAKLLDLRHDHFYNKATSKVKGSLTISDMAKVRGELMRRAAVMDDVASKIGDRNGMET